MNYGDLLGLVAPETIVVVTALAILLIDLTRLRAQPAAARMKVAVGITTAGCLIAILWLGLMYKITRLDGGILVIDPVTQLLKQFLLALTVFTAWISRESSVGQHVGEFFLLLLLASVGMMFLVSSENLLMIFVSLELLSLSLYVMVAFNKQSIQSAEAALKYFLFGGMSAAFMLFGLSLLYGLSGEIDLAKVASSLSGVPLDPLLLIALVMVLVGFGFKIAVVPFHLWAPDVYQGAPAPSAAFIASGSKVASFFVLGKVLLIGFQGAEGSGAWRAFSPGWIALIAILAALSIGLGNLAAIAQTSVRRLLAYSAVAHAGYALIGILANNREGMLSLLFYVTTYALATLGAFGVVAVVENKAGNERFGAFAGLSKRSPVISFCMLIFILSLAGIPPLAGFFGKFYVFTAGLQFGADHLGLLWLVIFAIAMSAVSLYYYLQVLKEIYVAAPGSDSSSIPVGAGLKTVLVILAAAVVVFGCLPNLILAKLDAAFTAAASF